VPIEAKMVQEGKKKSQEGQLPPDPLLLFPRTYALVVGGSTEILFALGAGYSSYATDCS